VNEGFIRALSLVALAAAIALAFAYREHSDIAAIQMDS